METVVMQDDGGDNQRSLRLIVVVGSRQNYWSKYIKRVKDFVGIGHAAG